MHRYLHHQRTSNKLIFTLSVTVRKLQVQKNVDVDGNIRTSIFIYITKAEKLINSPLDQLTQCPESASFNGINMF